MPGKDGTGPMGGGGRGQEAGGGRGRMGGPFAAGPGGCCVCPSCGYKAEHIVGQPCGNQKCIKCGATMTRGSGKT